MRFFFLFLTGLGIACVDHDTESTFLGESAAIYRASSLCDVPVGSMLWLETLIREMEADVTLKGNIYGVRTSGGVVIVHQPVLMSCLACIRYDCQGNRLDIESPFSEEIFEGMNSAHLLYRAH